MRSSTQHATLALGLTVDGPRLSAHADGVLVDRCCHRRIDPVTQTMYHLTDNPPPNDPAVLGRLIQREEDSEEQMRAKLDEYAASQRAMQVLPWAPVLDSIYVAAMLSRNALRC
eukprot:SAG11_NODE_73_length_18072_cov_8.670005_6_plen_114_part_00